MCIEQLESVFLCQVKQSEKFGDSIDVDDDLMIHWLWFLLQQTKSRNCLPTIKIEWMKNNLEKVRKPRWDKNKPLFAPKKQRKPATSQHIQIKIMYYYISPFIVIGKSQTHLAAARTMASMWMWCWRKVCLTQAYPTQLIVSGKSERAMRVDHRLYLVFQSSLQSSASSNPIGL